MTTVLILLAVVALVAAAVGHIRAAVVLAAVCLLLLLVGCGLPPAPPPLPPPPIDPGPPLPPPPPPDEPGEPVEGIPTPGMARGDVEARWGLPVDIPENPGEPDSVYYLLTLDGRPVQLHVVYEGGVVLRAVVSHLVTSGSD